MPKINYHIKLIGHVNSYLDYDERVKNNLIEQINKQKKIDKKLYNKTINQIPKTLKAVKKYYHKIDLVNKLFKEFKKDKKDPSKNKIILTDGREYTVAGAKTKKKAIENVVLGNR